MTNWFLYLLECADGSLYAGIATDVAARYAAHAAGKGARYTRSRPPRRLLGWMAYPDRASASRAEYALKQLRPAVKRLFATTMQQGDPPMTVARKSSRSQPRVPAAEAGAASDSDESRLAGTVTLASDAVLPISSRVAIPFGEISMQAIRAQGAGGQNVNKVSSAIHLRFDIHRSSLPELYKQRLLALQDQRISQDGVIVIKAQTQRSQERNRVEALQRLQQLVRGVMIKAAPRKPTQVPPVVKRQRLADKRQRAELKAGRGKVRDA